MLQIAQRAYNKWLPSQYFAQGLPCILTAMLRTIFCKYASRSSNRQATSVLQLLLAVSFICTAWSIQQHIVITTILFATLALLIFGLLDTTDITASLNKSKNSNFKANYYSLITVIITAIIICSILSGYIVQVL